MHYNELRGINFGSQVKGDGSYTEAREGRDATRQAGRAGRMWKEKAFSHVAADTMRRTFGATLFS